METRLEAVQQRNSLLVENEENPNDAAELDQLFVVDQFRTLSDSPLRADYLRVAEEPRSELRSQMQLSAIVLIQPHKLRRYFYYFKICPFYCILLISCNSCNLFTFVMIQKFFCKNRDVKACKIIVLILLNVLNKKFSLTLRSISYNLKYSNIIVHSVRCLCPCHFFPFYFHFVSPIVFH